MVQVDTMNEFSSISVVIPTFNRADMLAKVLSSYLEPAVVGEVLIVDDGSQDQTAALVEGFTHTDSRICLLRHERNKGRTFARNTGIAHARGNLVLFSEDDLALAPGSLETLVSHMQETDADIIAGRRIWIRIGETAQQALARANRNRRPVVNIRLMDHNSHAITPTDVQVPLVDATMLVRREVLDRVQFADCYPGNAWREESDFQLTAQEQGFKVVFCPHALFYHYDRAMAGRGRNRLKSDLIYLRWIFQNNLTFLRRHREYLRQTLPESLLLGSPLLTSLLYIAYRSVWLTQAEIRRIWHSRTQA